MSINVMINQYMECFIYKGISRKLIGKGVT